MARCTIARARELSVGPVCSFSVGVVHPVGFERYIVPIQDCVHFFLLSDSALPRTIAYADELAMNLVCPYSPECVEGEFCEVQVRE